MRKQVATLILLTAVLLAPVSAFCAPSDAAAPLPASPYPVHIDGNPREAFLLGALFFPMHSAITGKTDGSVKTYVLAVRKGLYVAVLSTEPDGGRGLLMPLPWTSPAEAVLCDWMAVRIGPPKSAVLFILGPGGYRGAMDARGRKVKSGTWSGASSIFGRTWAGEWLIPWKTLNAGAGGILRLQVLRGRKTKRGRYSQEDLAQLSSGPASGRWGGDGILVKIPRSFPASLSRPEALSNYEVRPFVPPDKGRAVCRAAAPAGEVVTAWIEIPSGDGKVQVKVGKGLNNVKVFRLDFWWQAGRRVAIDSLFPSLVAQGLGDVFVGERLFPQPAKGFKDGEYPMRIYVRGKIPLNTFKPGRGTLDIPIDAIEDGKPADRLWWKIEVAPALPTLKRLAGLYYLERDQERWAKDLSDIAAHGITAVTCPSRDVKGWKAFQAATEAAGLDGRWALHPDCVPPGEKAWGYVTDEPATRTAIAEAGRRARTLRARGLKTWGALAWPNSLCLDDVLDGIAVPPNLVREAASLSCQRKWVYVQGLRENPFYNRVWVSLLARAPGLDGFWVFCYAPGSKRPVNDWRGPIIRYDALVDPDGAGGRLQTVQWEALREGILDGRLIDALGPEARKILGRFPGALDAMHGKYWKAENRGWSFAKLRKALVDAWAEKNSSVVGGS